MLHELLEADFFRVVHDSLVLALVDGIIVFDCLHYDASKKVPLLQRKSLVPCSRLESAEKGIYLSLFVRAESQLLNELGVNLIMQPDLVSEDVDES